MSRKLIIDGNAVYEIDEECMLRQRIRGEGEEKDKGGKYKNKTEESGRQNRRW